MWESIPCPVEEVKDSSMYKGKQQDHHPGGGGRSTGGRHHHLCQWPGDWAGHQQHDHSAGAHQDGEGSGYQGEAQDGLLRKLSVANSGTDHLLLWRALYLRQLQLSLGIDISASYGAAVRAADGGTVTYAGYKGSYGKLVIITHDNGTQTYYGHNSSLLVSRDRRCTRASRSPRRAAPALHRRPLPL